MKILDKSYQKYGAKPLREYEKDVEKALSLHRDREYLPKDYLDHIGSKEKFSDHVVFDADPRRGHDEIELAGDLKRDKKNIEKLLKNREDIEKRISETTDTRRHKDMQNKLKEIDKDLADYGKSSQRLAKDTISDLQDHLENVRDTHSTTLEAIDAHHDKLKKAVDDIKLTTANEIDLATVKNLGDAEVSFKIKGAGGAEREFTIKNGAVSETGVTGAIKLDPAKELREFQDKAKEVIGDHIDAKIDVIERGAEQHAEVIQKQISHLEEHQNFLIEKTKIGKAAEGTKKLPGKTSVGTKLAEEKGIIGEAKYAELGGVSKAMADVKANWHSGLGGKIKVALGAGFIADGARRTIKGASALMSGDPEKQAEAGWGDVLVGVPEAIGGGLLARLGGSKHAMGLGA